VSIVLNARAGSERIPAVTRERILAAARDLNYRPNVLAQSLRRGRAFAIRGYLAARDLIASRTSHYTALFASDDDSPTRHA
jgi:DNA-binding LacI/PurR family transcriptional regulator